MRHFLKTTEERRRLTPELELDADQDPVELCPDNATDDDEVVVDSDSIPGEVDWRSKHMKNKRKTFTII
jgi:hypothetical protein